MRDSICLIQPKNFINDKSYSNLTEFAFRNTLITDYLRLSHAEARVGDGRCSDFDILKSLVESLKNNSDTASRVYRYFSRVLGCFKMDADDVLAGNISVEELWRETSKALSKRENTLHGMLSRSGIRYLGVAQAPWEYEKLPERIGDATISSVICPLGVREKNILDVDGFDDLSMLRRHLECLAESGEDIAIFFDEPDFEFCEPNPYGAEMAYNKYRKGLPMKNVERNILRSQLLRDTFFAAAKNERRILFVLPNTENIKVMYQAEQLFDYIDDCIPKRSEVVLFAPDVVSFSFAASCEARKYKKITVEAAICGVDRYLMTDDDVKYWGLGRLPKSFASLCEVPAYFDGLFI